MENVALAFSQEKAPEEIQKDKSSRWRRKNKASFKCQNISKKMEMTVKKGGEETSNGERAG